MATRYLIVFGEGAERAWFGTYVDEDAARQVCWHLSVGGFPSAHVEPIASADLCADGAPAWSLPQRMRVVQAQIAEAMRLRDHYQRQLDALTNQRRDLWRERYEQRRRERERAAATPDANTAER